MPPLVRILVGSETGFAREIATQIGLDLQDYKILTGCGCHPLPRLDVEIHLLDDFLRLQHDDSHIQNKSKLRPSDFTLFIVSTTGDGECPSTMAHAWKKMLRRNCTLEFLHNSSENCAFSVFGLGDSGYEKFNVVAKMLYNRMVQLGGAPVAFRGTGDENDVHAVSATDFRVGSTGEGSGSACASLGTKRTGVYVELIPWVHEVRRAIGLGWPVGDLDCPLNTGSDPIRLPPLKHVAFPESPGSSADKPEASNQPPVASVTSNTRITSSDHFQDVRHVEMSVAPGRMNTRPSPGGLFGFYPPNAVVSLVGIMRFLSVPAGVLEMANRVIQARNIDLQCPRDALWRVCSPDARPILRRGLGNAAVDDGQVLELVYLAVIRIRVDSTGSGQAGGPESTAHGNIHVGIASTEDFYCRRSVPLLDFLLFALDLEKPPKACFLRQLLFWFGQPHDLKGKTVPEYLDGLHGHSYEQTDEISPLQEDVQEKIMEFVSCADTKEYENYFTKEYRSVVEFLDDFDSIFRGTGRAPSPFVMPLADFISYCPFILPRLYSISSGFPPESIENQSAFNVSITVGIVEFQTVHDRTRLGHVSRYLREAAEDDSIACMLPRPHFRPGQADHGFVYSTDPIVFLATGIGVSACRSIYLSREAYFKGSRSEEGDVFLYGCRYAAKDFLYQNDFSRCFGAFTRDGKYPTVAFSREHPGRKLYIQNILYDSSHTISPSRPTGNTEETSIGEHVAHLITSKNASIFVCGSSKNLPGEIRDALAFILVEYSPEIKDTETARRFLHHLTKTKKFIMDTW